MWGFFIALGSLFKPTSSSLLNVCRKTLSSPDLLPTRIDVSISGLSQSSSAIEPRVFIVLSPFAPLTLSPPIIQAVNLPFALAFRASIAFTISPISLF